MYEKYEIQNRYKGAFFLVFSKEKFVEIAISDGMARNLAAEDQRKRADERGEDLLNQWEQTYKRDYSEMREQIIFELWSSFWTVFCIVGVALIISATLGSVGLEHQFNPKKLVSVLGSALVAWAALMELGGNFPVWDGDSFPQLAHKVVFKIIFVPGILLVTTGILL